MKFKADAKNTRTQLAERLSNACEKADASAVERLLKEGANPDGFMSQEGSPLSDAVNARSRKIVKILLDAGADVNKSGPYHGQTPLELAGEKGYVEIAKYLLDRGADVNKNGYWSPLETAISYGQLESVRLFLRHRANLKSSWLTRSSRHKSFALIMEELIKAGADPNHHESDNLDDLMSRGYVPLHVTCIKPDATRVLLKAGADPNRQYFLTKDTPLHRAAKHGSLEVVEMLVEAGADISITNKEGKTAEQMAKRHGHKEIVEFLRTCSPQIKSAQPTTRESRSLTKPIPQRSKPPKIELPAIRGHALNFTTGLSNFISLVDELGGACAMLAVESPIDRVVPEFCRMTQPRNKRENIEVVSSKKRDPVSSRWIPVIRTTESAWTVIFSFIGFNLNGQENETKEHAKVLSKQLEARVFAFFATETGAGCFLFEAGCCTGADGWEGSGDKAEGLFKKLRCFVPECYVTEQEEDKQEVVRLAVRPLSQGKIASVTLVLPKD
ncbi:MAG: hypothetical protein HOP33_00395 [Verrucomicrobia bacterium]|nr:hypothetical protein [Verrucomicrobiota bacterium]